MKLLWNNAVIIRNKNRRGAVLITVIICLILVAMIVLGLVRMVLAERVQVQVATWRVQADWLAESAIERAAAKLNQDDTYTGETWEFSPEEMQTSFGGKVVITVSAVPEKPSERQVQAVAHFPADQAGHARLTRVWRIVLAEDAP